MVKDIFLAKIRFTDESDEKIRPIVLIQKNSFGDYIFLPLTTNLKTNGIIINSKDVEHGTLPKKSVIVIEKISTISPSLFLRKLATVKESIFNNTINDVCDFIKKSKE